MSCRGLNFLYTSLTVVAVLIQYLCKASDVTKPNAGNQEIEFQCHDPGVFPDPYSCSIYYLCGDPPVSQVPVPEYDYETRHVCPEGTQFDVLKESCVHVEDNDTCTEPPVPPCEQLFQTAALERNPSIYFICIKSIHHDLQPKLYKCPANEIYDSEHFTCKTITTSSPVTTTHSQTVISSEPTDSSTAAITTGSGASSTEIATKAESITPESSSQISISISSTENPKSSSTEIFTSTETSSTEDPHISTQSTTEDVSHNSTEGTTNSIYTKNTKITDWNSPEVSSQTTPNSAGNITDTETSTESSPIFTPSTTEAVSHNSTGGSTDNGTSRYTKHTGITDWSTPELSSQTTANTSAATLSNPTKPSEDTTISSTENNNGTQSFSSKNSYKSSESTPLTTQSGITDISSGGTTEHTGTSTTSEETEKSSHSTDDSSTEISSTITETGSTDQHSSQTTTGQVIILPDIVVMTNFIAKPKQMIVNIVYDFVEDGNATNPTDAPPVTVPARSTVTASPVTVPQTATPVTTTAGTATTSNGEFHCTSEGIFADPKDCTKFYRCSKALVASHDKCFLGHYDPSSQGCAFGSC